MVESGEGVEESRRMFLRFPPEFCRRRDARRRRRAACAARRRACRRARARVGGAAVVGAAGAVPCSKISKD